MKDVTVSTEVLDKARKEPHINLSTYYAVYMPVVIQGVPMTGLIWIKFAWLNPQVGPSLVGAGFAVTYPN